MRIYLLFSYLFFAWYCLILIVTEQLLWKNLGFLIGKPFMESAVLIHFFNISEFFIRLRILSNCILPSLSALSLYQHFLFPSCADSWSLKRISPTLGTRLYGTSALYYTLHKLHHYSANPDVVSCTFFCADNCNAPRLSPTTLLVIQWGGLLGQELQRYISYRCKHFRSIQYYNFL